MDKVSAKVAAIFFPPFSAAMKSGGGEVSPTGLPQAFRVVSRLRQMFVLPKYRSFWWSVVRAGTFQVRFTRLPLRAACKSVGGLGNSSEGGMGGPIDAHPVMTKSAASGLSRFRLICMRRNNKGTTNPCQLAVSFSWGRR